MKRFIAITAVIVVGFAALASAQTTTSKPLADVAKDEEARRKASASRPRFTPTTISVNDISRGVPAAAVAGHAEPRRRTRRQANTPGQTAPANAPRPPRKDQAYWSGRIDRGPHRRRAHPDPGGLAAEPHQCADHRLRQSRRSGATGQDRSRAQGRPRRARTHQEGARRSAEGDRDD